MFGLEAPPERIEVYDNSHIQGTNADRRDDRRRARGLHQEQPTASSTSRPRAPPGDDFAMMREVLRAASAARSRRIPERDEEHWPDLVLIDGGQGQLEVGARGAGRARRRRHRRGRHRQGPRPRRRPRALLHARASRPSRSSRATRCSTSSSACATRRTASPSAPTAPGAPRDITRSPLDEIAGIGAAPQARAAAPFRLGPRGRRGGARGHQVGRRHRQARRQEDL